MSLAARDGCNRAGSRGLSKISVNAGMLGLHLSARLERLVLCFRKTF